MSTAAKIIEKFGGQRRLADLLGHENQTTVQGWARRGVIPIRQVPLVIRAARRLGIEVKLEDFIPT